MSTNPIKTKIYRMSVTGLREVIKKNDLVIPVMPAEHGIHKVRLLNNPEIFDYAMIDDIELVDIEQEIQKAAAELFYHAFPKGGSNE